MKSVANFLSGLSLDNLCQFLGIKIIIAWFIVFRD